MQLIPYSPTVIGLTDATDVQYFADPAINNSSLKTILDYSPLHLHSKAVKKESSAMRVGTLIHSMILDQPMDHYVIHTKTKGLDTKAGAATIEANPGMTVVTDQEYGIAEAVMRGCEHSPAVTVLRECAAKEVGLFIVGKDGVRKKAKIDAVNFGLKKIYDLKTTADIRGFPFDARSYKYHMQTAWYLSLIEEYTGESGWTFETVIVEKSRPFSAISRVYSDRVLEEGKKLVERAYDLYAMCREQSFWPGPDLTGEIDWFIKEES